MVDETRVLRLLRSVSDDVAFLRREALSDAARREDPVWLRGIKYTFVTAIEACVDAAQHMCSAQGWGPPRDNGDAMTLLGRHDVVPAELAQQMRRAVGFRNVLVHEYIGVRDEIVLSRLDDVTDLEAFVAAVAHFVTEGSGNRG